jgi:hypothetical protein
MRLARRIDRAFGVGLIEFSASGDLPRWAEGQLFVTLLRRMMRRRSKPLHLVLDGLPAHKTALAKAYVGSRMGC